MEIAPVDVPTLFLIGDSTVCDQSKEPYNSWGQMLPRWFKPEITIANHGESGETYRDSIGRRRLDKILQLAQCIVLAIREQKLPMAKFITEDFKGFNPARPEDPDAFAVPASGEFTNQRPLGDETNK